MSLFVDTSAWYAAADRGDKNNVAAKSILAAGESLVTSDHVLVESSFLLRHRLGRVQAARFWEGLRAGAAQVELVSSADLEAAWFIGELFADQDFSIVDRTSFAVMERLGLRQVVTFDDDFAIYRFGPKRNRAFEVIR